MEERGQSTDRGNKALSIQYTNNQIKDLQEEKEHLEHERNIEIENSTKPRRVSHGNRILSSIFSFARRRKSKHASGAEKTTPEAQRGTNSKPRKEPSVLERNGARDQSSSSKLEQSNASIKKNNEKMDAQNLGRGNSVDSTVYSGAYDRIIDLAGFSNSNHRQTRGVDLHQKTNLVDRSYNAALQQTSAMGCDSFEIAIYHPNRRLKRRFWNQGEVLKSMAWLKRENTKGSDIYIKPGNNKNEGIILLENLSKKSISELKTREVEPALILETSPKKYEAWIKLSSHEIPLEIASLATKKLYSAVEGKGYIPSFHSFGRLAGFTNKDPSIASMFGHPSWVLCREASGKKATASQKVLKVTEKIKARQDKEQMIRYISSIEMAKKGYSKTK